MFTQLQLLAGLHRRDLEGLPGVAIAGTEDLIPAAGHLGRPGSVEQYLAQRRQQWKRAAAPAHAQPIQRLAKQMPAFEVSGADKMHHVALGQALGAVQRAQGQPTRRTGILPNELRHGGRINVSQFVGGDLFRQRWLGPQVKCHRARIEWPVEPQVQRRARVLGDGEHREGPAIPSHLTPNAPRITSLAGALCTPRSASLRA